GRVRLCMYADVLPRRRHNELAGCLCRGGHRLFAWKLPDIASREGSSVDFRLKVSPVGEPAADGYDDRSDQQEYGQHDREEHHRGAPLFPETSERPDAQQDPSSVYTVGAHSVRIVAEACRWKAGRLNTIRLNWNGMVIFTVTG